MSIERFSPIITPMCGRFAIYSKPADYLVSLTLDPPIEPCDAVENYNAHPTQYLPAVYQNNNTFRCDLLHWGLIPSWSKDTKIGYKTSNARSEIASEKPSFRHAYKHQRCLIPADGWYEWLREGANKQPYYHHRPDQQVSWLAGLWENWVDPKTGESIRSFTLLTKEAEGKAAEIHNRMPVIMQPGNFSTWLSHDLANKVDINELISKQPMVDFDIFPVSSNMNKPQFNNKECINSINL